MKLTNHDIDLLCDPDISWEDTFGVDNPDYLPYWVKYMPIERRLSYLTKFGSQFTDFSTDMLKPMFNWQSWEHRN